MLVLPTAIPWDGTNPFGALRAEFARQGWSGDNDEIETFINDCELTVIGGKHDENGPRESDRYDDVLDHLYSELWDDNS